MAASAGMFTATAPGGGIGQRNLGGVSLDVTSWSGGVPTDLGQQNVYNPLPIGVPGGASLVLNQDAAGSYAVAGVVPLNAWHPGSPS